MWFSTLTVILALTSDVMGRGFGATNQGYNYTGIYYPINYTKNTLALSGRDFGYFNTGAFNTWIGNSRCNINRVWYRGETCARGMVARAIKDAANGVVRDTGDSANTIAFTNQTNTKSYVQQDQGQGPSVSGEYTNDTPATCSAAYVQYAGDSYWYPNFKGVKATCKTACGGNTFADVNIDGVLDQLFTGMRDQGSFMSHFVLWNTDTNLARVRCRVTIADRYQDVDGCPDAIPGMGCNPAPEEKDP